MTTTQTQSTGHYHDPEGKFDYCDDPKCPRSRATSIVKCSTIGCKHDATHVLTYSFPESRDVIEKDVVCQSCGEAYTRRPTLRATMWQGIR